MTIGMRLIAIGLVVSLGGAQATLLTVQGDFTIGSVDNPLPDLGVFSGAFSFTYDDAGVSDTGYTTTIGVPLDTLSLSPNYGGFDLSDTFGTIQFLDGALDHVVLTTQSDDPLDDLLTVISGTNDFAISYYQSTTLNDFAIATEQSPTLYEEGSGYPYSGSVWMTALVPEPEDPGLAAAVLLMLALARRWRGDGRSG